uniref:Uncharacterized protein n=1 Tax=Physcomitrium patens TaxID=3218 RepID=A0A2K1L8Z2_PHYPA|nr:hypothetical protein PHYPA_000911 [Physcomitrium patens]
MTHSLHFSACHDLVDRWSGGFHCPIEDQELGRELKRVHCELQAPPFFSVSALLAEVLEFVRDAPSPSLWSHPSCSLRVQDALLFLSGCATCGFWICLESSRKRTSGFCSLWCARYT